MKKRKVFSFITASVMALASLSVLSATAETATPNVLMGDIDGDGYITGHDTAMLSRAFYVGGAELTEEQTCLADLNGDKNVNLDDLNALHEMEEVVIGGFRTTFKPEEYFNANLKVAADKNNCPTLTSAYYALIIDCNRAVNRKIVVCSEEEYAEKASGENTEFVYITDDTVYVSDVVYNVLDADADGVVDFLDCYNILHASNMGLCLLRSIYPQENRYDLCGTKEEMIPEILTTRCCKVLRPDEYVAYLRLTNDPDFTMTVDEYALSLGYSQEDIDYYNK